jgi:hypothetical protein
VYGDDPKARRRKADADMKMHYRVQTILLSRERSAVTLSPVEWVRPDGPAVDEDGSPVNWKNCEPNEPEAEPFEPGGKMTELRIEGSVGWEPDDFVTVTVESTEHHWKGSAADL